MADLDARMAAIRANPALMHPPAEQDPSSPPATPPAESLDAPLSDDQPPATPASPGSPPPDATPPEAPAQPTTQQPQYSRRDAVRLAEQLADAEARITAAEARAVQAQQHAHQQAEALALRTKRDEDTLKEFQGKQAQPGEIEALTRQLANPDLDWQDDQRIKGRLAEISAAQDTISPYLAFARAELHGAFAQGLAGLVGEGPERTHTGLAGVSKDVAKAVWDAPSGDAALRLMYETGTKAAKGRYEAQIADLQAQLADTKVKLAARMPQPVIGSDVPIPTDGKILRFQTDSRGLPTDEAIEAAKKGSFAAVAP